MSFCYIYISFTITYDAHTDENDGKMLILTTTKNATNVDFDE